ncbi:MAG: class I SAM-dependent rRNA methyltransferase [PVC group bacterium]|nr:class I SAM-dependent rRNA methyltransferase [PVC group bacterium]
MATVILKPAQDSRIATGYPRVFNSQIRNIQGNFKPGDIVSIKNSQSRFLGRGYINPGSNIPVRILTRADEPIDKEFLTRRIKQAIDFRKKIITEDTNVYRLVFSESDFLPGLIVDVYGNCLVVQILTLGMESRKDLIIDILQEFMKPKGIYLRNDTPARMMEGLVLEKKGISGRFGTKVEVRENGIPFVVDIENGQKTGFYIDRRDNRYFLKQLVKDKSVLDCFCYTGAFSTYACSYGAAKLVGADISAHSLKYARTNMRLNKISSRRYDFKEEDAFNLLRSLDKRKETFDVVILDPPSLVSSKNKIAGGLRGYRELNLRALRILNRGGTLVTISGSYHVQEHLFKQLIQEVAEKEGRIVRVINWGQQASDHPSFLNIKENSYLKCLVAEIL